MVCALQGCRACPIDCMGYLASCVASGYQSGSIDRCHLQIDNPRLSDKDKPPFSRPSTRIGWSGISGVGFRIEHTSAAINCSVWSAVGVRGGVINKLRAICGRFLTPAIRNASKLKTKQAVGGRECIMGIWVGMQGGCAPVKCKHTSWRHFKNDLHT